MLPVLLAYSEEWSLGVLTGVGVWEKERPEWYDLWDPHEVWIRLGVDREAEAFVLLQL